MTQSRRTFLAATAVGAASLALPPAASSAPAALGSAAPVTSRVRDFIAGLDEPKRRAASFPWSGEQWRRWDYFGATGYAKPGLRLEQMTGIEKDRAWDIFASLLSADGLAKARNVMLLQDVLVSEGDGVGQRHRDRFSVSVFGTPGPTGPWGLRLEGHHLSLSFAVRDDQIIAVTPAAFAARPARVQKGPHKGLNTIDAEERLARRLFADLSPALQARARVRDDKLFNILSTAGQERANAKKIGLPAADMTSAQRDLLAALIDVYVVQPYAAAYAGGQTARAKAGDPAATHFAWYGPNSPERGFGYRIIADAFVIEMGSIDSAGQHLHPVYHDLANVLGNPA